MPLLKVANVWFNSAGTSRIDYYNDNVVRIVSNATVLSVGTTDNRPVGEPGMIRYNETTGNFEGYNANAWGAIAGSIDLEPVFTTGNTAYIVANNAYDQANTTWTYAANIVMEVANSAYAAQNTTYTFAANTVRLIANSAFDRANIALNVANTLNSLSKTDGNFLVANGTGWTVESGSTARTSLGLGSVATLDATNIEWKGASYTISTSSPSGGVDGDFWFTRDA